MRKNNLISVSGHGDKVLAKAIKELQQNQNRIIDEIRTLKKSTRTRVPRPKKD